MPPQPERSAAHCLLNMPLSLLSHLDKIGLNKKLDEHKSNFLHLSEISEKLRL
jgi:hypothetical protein